MHRMVYGFLAWLRTPEGRQASPSAAQRRFTLLRLRFNAGLTQFDIFTDALSMRGEVDRRLAPGLDVAAADASRSPAASTIPRRVTYLDRGHGAAIRRARTRLPGGGIPGRRSSASLASGWWAAASPPPWSTRSATRARRSSISSSLSASPSRPASGRPGEIAMAVGLWERWISEIVADFWSVAKLGVAAARA